jgi:hypothetical protein
MHAIKMNLTQLVILLTSRLDFLMNVNPAIHKMHGFHLPLIMIINISLYIPGNTRENGIYVPIAILTRLTIVCFPVLLVMSIGKVKWMMNMKMYRDMFITARHVLIVTRMEKKTISGFSKKILK